MGRGEEKRPVLAGQDGGPRLEDTAPRSVWAGVLIYDAVHDRDEMPGPPDTLSRRALLGLACGTAASLAGCSTLRPDVAQPPTPTDWSMSGGNPQGSYHTAAEGGPVDGVETRWTYEFDQFQPSRVEPLLYDDRLYVPGLPTAVVDVTNGAARTFEGRFRSSPAIVTETAYRNETLVGLQRAPRGGSPLGSLFPAFGLAGVNPSPGLDRLSDGRRRWNFPEQPGSVRPWNTDTPAPPAVADGRVYLGGRWTNADATVVGGVAALDPSNGTVEWTYTRRTAPESPIPFGRPSVHDGTAYAPTLRHVVHAIDTSDGSERWSTDVLDDEGASVPPVVATDDVVVVVEDEEVVGLRRADGSELWRTPLDGFLTSAVRRPVAATDETTVVALDSDPPELVALATPTGEVRWRVTPERPTSPPVVAGGVVYAGTDEGVVALDRTDGNQRWRFAPSDPVSPFAVPVVGPRGLYVAGRETLYALREADG